MPEGDDAVRRPYARGRDRKTELLRAAAAVFARHGYQGTSIAAIAAEAGMTDAGVLHHYSSKATLYATVMEHRVRDGDLDEMLGEDQSLEGTLDSMVAYVHWLAQQLSLLRFRAMVSGEALVEGNPARAILVAEHARSFPVLTSKLSAAQRDGRIDPSVDPEQAVLELMAMNEGLRHMAVTNEGAFDYGDVFERAARRWYEGLRVAQPLVPGGQPAI
jgi:AcrR family transcriptional regulator